MEENMAKDQPIDDAAVTASDPTVVAPEAPADPATPVEAEAPQEITSEPTEGVEAPAPEPTAPAEQPAPEVPEVPADPTPAEEAKDQVVENASSIDGSGILAQTNQEVINSLPKNENGQVVIDENGQVVGLDNASQPSQPSGSVE